MQIKINEKLIGTIKDAKFDAENGYIRFANGLQVAWQEQEITGEFTKWADSVYFLNVEDLPDWAMPFKEVYQQYSSSNQVFYWFGNSEPAVAKPGTIRAFRINGGTYTLKIKTFAFGTWK